MRTRTLLCSICAGVVLAGVATAGPTGLAEDAFSVPIGKRELMVRKRLTNQIYREADQLLSADPDDADGQSLRGVALAIEGWPSEALASFELAVGGDFYEKEGFRYHAESLRITGRGDEAAALRREFRMVPSPNPYGYIAIEANVVDDLHAAGQWDEALVAAERLLATDPGNSLVHSTVADLMWSLGFEDEALFQLFLVTGNGKRNFRYREVLARIAADGDLPEVAAKELAQARKQRPRHPRIRAFQLAVQCELGVEEETLREFGYPRFANHGHPDLLAAEGECRARRGEVAQAQALADDLRLLFPELTQAQAAVTRIEQAVASQ